MRASGPGGQNVNKLSTAVQLRFDVRRSPSLPGEVRTRLERLAGSRLTRDGVLVIIAQRHRTQPRNRQDALDRLIDLDPPGGGAAAQTAADQTDQSLARAPHRRQETPRRRQASAARQAGDSIDGEQRRRFSRLKTCIWVISKRVEAGAERESMPRIIMAIA